MYSELRTRNFELRTSAFWLRLFVDPFDAGDFRCAVPPQGKKRPSKPTIDIEPAARLSVMPIDPPIASGREPERRHARYAPLASVAVSAEDQIDGVVVFQLIEDVRRMGQQEGEAVLCTRRQAAQVGAMQRWIVHADNGDLAAVRANEGSLIDQEGDLVAIGEFAIPIDRHAAVMVMVAQRDEDRRNLAQVGEKPKDMRQPLRDVDQVTGDKDPVGAEFADGGDDAIMPWLIAVEVQIAQMNGPATGQEAVRIGEP